MCPEQSVTYVSERSVDTALLQASSAPLAEDFRGPDHVFELRLH